MLNNYDVLFFLFNCDTEALIFKKWAIGLADSIGNQEISYDMIFDLFCWKFEKRVKIWKRVIL